MTGARCAVLAVIGLLAACDSGLITIDLGDLDPCPNCPDLDGPITLPPSVWLEGRAWADADTPLTGRDALVRISPDSTFFSAFQSASVDSTDGRFARSIDVAEVCDQVLFAKIQIRDADGAVLEESAPVRLFEGGTPKGCPFPAAALVNGVPTDTVTTRDLVLGGS